MDIATQAEVYLREAGYETWAWTGASPPVVCFENATIMGFIHEFDTAEALLGNWEAAQQKVLARHAPALRTAGAKAWNVYSVFLTSQSDPDRKHLIERLEEDFALTRKLARTAVQTLDDLAHVLMPLTPIRSKPLLQDSDIGARLRSRAKDLPSSALSAFLGAPTAEEVADILRGQP